VICFLQTDSAAGASSGKLEASLSFLHRHSSNRSPPSLSLSLPHILHAGAEPQILQAGEESDEAQVEDELHGRALTSPPLGSTRPPPSRLLIWLAAGSIRGDRLDSRRRGSIRGGGGRPPGAPLRPHDLLPRRPLLTDKRRIPLRSASVRTPHLFHHGIPKVLVNPRSKGITSVRSTTTH
jgi:hypothetical protein